LAAYAANIAAATGQQHPLAAQNFNAASLAAAAQQQVFWILEFWTFLSLCHLSLELILSHYKSPVL